MVKTLEEAKYIAPLIHQDEFKELGLKKSMNTREASAFLREKLGLAIRSRTRGINSISGVARNKEYSDDEKEKIIEFMKGMGSEKEAETQE